MVATYATAALRNTEQAHRGVMLCDEIHALINPPNREDVDMTSSRFERCVPRTRGGLLQQFGYFLLYAVGLSEGRDAGLAEDLVLGEVGGGLRVVGCLHCILR